MNVWEQRMAMKAKLIPETGFNLVEVDNYAREIDDELELLAHYDTAEEAAAEKAELLAEDPTRILYIYDKDGSFAEPPEEPEEPVPPEGPPGEPPVQSAEPAPQPDPALKSWAKGKVPG